MEIIIEAGRVDVQEIEERHYRGDKFIRQNVIAHLDIYEQAKDNGRWIMEAGEAAMA